MATYISKQTGDWSSATTWLTAANGTVTPANPTNQSPQSNGNDKIVIRNNHVVTYDVPTGIWGDGMSNVYGGSDANQPSLLLNNAIYLSAGGTLKASRFIDTEFIIKGALVLGNYGVLDWGTKTDPLTTTATIWLSGKKDGNSTIAQPVGGNFAVHRTQAGNVSMYGITKTRNTFFTASAAAGSTSIQVLSALNWKVGDKLVIESDNTVTSRCLFTEIAAGYVSGSTTVPITNPLNFNRSVNTAISNYTSNITVDAYPGSSTAGGILLYAGDISKYEIGYITIKNIGTISTIWAADNGNQTAGSGGAGASLTLDAQYGGYPILLEGIAFDRTNLSFVSNTNVIEVRNPNRTSSNTINDICIVYNQNFLPTSQYAGAIRFSGSAVVDCNRFFIYNAYYVTTMYASLNPTVNDSILNGRYFQFTENGNFFLNCLYNNCKIKHDAPSGGGPVSNNFCHDPINTSIGTITYNNTTITLATSSSPLVDYGYIRSGTVNFLNCTFPNQATYSLNPTRAPWTTSPTFIVSVFNLNSTSNHRSFNSFYYSQNNNTIRKNGITSLAMRSETANLDFYMPNKISAIGNTRFRVKGNIRFDSTYGTANPPSISFVGLGINQTFTCPPVANTWHTFDYDFLPNSTGDISVTLKGKSQNTSGYVYLDGLPIYPFIQDARWYGFVFDNFPNRTVDSKITSLENQVSSYPAVFNLNNLYDEATYWSVTNPTLTSYIDITIPNGKILEAGSNNIVLDNTYSTNFEYLSASKTLTLKTLSLSSTTNFDTIKTTGNVYLSGSSYLTNMTLDGTVFVNTPQNLQNTNITNVRYNSNTVTDITYKNCVVDNVQNSGTGLLTITLDNSTVNSSSGNVSLLVNPTILNITNLNGGYISIFDNNGVLQYYQNSNGLISLPSGSTGTWSYKIGRYNYKTIEETFEVNPLNGITINIDPSYSFDSFVSQTNVSITSAYSVFNNLQQVYDYLSYFRTTITGLSGYSSSDFYSYRSTLDIINNDLVLNVNAPNLFSYDGKTLTLSSNKLEAGDIIKGIETSNNIYLSGSAMLSGLNVTVGKGLYIEKAYDLYNTNVYVGTIAYYEDIAPVSILYTNCNVNKVVNNGSKTITITRINSTIIDATDAEIATTVPIIINITASVDTYVAIYKPDGTRYHYGNGNVTKILGGDAVTGNWTYKIYRYGYVGRTGSFFIDADVSSTTTIVGTGLLTDTGITENNPAIVSAYTDLNSTFKIYDYLSYYKTTSNGIDLGDIATKAIGTLFINIPLTLDATASNVLDYQSTPSILLTLKCSGLSENVDLYVTGDFLNINGTTLSKDLHIRSTNLDSEIELIGINEIKFFQTESDRDNNLNVGPIFTLVDIIRFKHGNVYSGVTFSGLMRVRVDVGSTLLYSFPITIGNNILDLGTFGQIQQVLNAQKTMNTGIQKASKLIPYTQNI